MRIEIGRETPEAIERLPEHQSDGSRIGVNYADVIMKGIAAFRKAVDAFAKA
jgi:hypothetical protein